jgi:hypothetical protein
MRVWCPSWGLRAVVVLSALGCHQTDVVGTVDGPRSLPGVDSGEVADGGSPGRGRGRDDAAADVPRGMLPTCAAAASSFSRALCACGQVESFGDFRSGSLRADARADVAVGGTLRVAAFAGPVSGDLTVAGNGLSLLAGDAGRVSGALRVNSELRLRGETRVDGSAWLRGVLMGDGVLYTAGDLYQPRPRIATSEAGTPLVQHEGSLIVGEVVVESPCACDAATQLDVVGRVAEAAADDASRSAQAIAASALADAPDSFSLDLPPGPIYLDEIASRGDLTLHATGASVLFIAGDLSIRGSLRAELADAAEIELWVAGDMAVRGAIVLAPRDRPSATRLFVAGQTIGEPGPAGAPGREVIEDLATPAQRDNPDAEWVVNLYAPRVDLSLGTDTDVYGALFVRSLLSVGDLRMHHDPQVVERGIGCHDP